MTRPHEVAIVLAAHGNRGGTGDNRVLLDLRGAIKREAQFAAVMAGVLKGAPTLEEALLEASRSGAPLIAVYPFFMADGYFTGTVLPGRIEAAGLGSACRILPPFGLDSGLPPLMLAQALDAAATAGFDPQSSRLLVAGHGSKLGPASARATRRAAAAMGRLGGFGSVETAFLEEPPLLEAQLAGNHPPTVVSGFFSGEGLHAGEDVPSAINSCRANAVYCGAIGASDSLPALVQDAILRALAPVT
jgi:sirohydrochlorin ferrochelatase